MSEFFDSKQRFSKEQHIKKRVQEPLCVTINFKIENNELPKYK